jgi:hypothetical protein
MKTDCCVRYSEHEADVCCRYNDAPKVSTSCEGKLTPIDADDPFNLQ